MGRSTASQSEKYVAFKTAYETISHYREQGNFIAAYTIAFSLIEDRIRAMAVVRYRADNQCDPSLKYINSSFSLLVRGLVKLGDMQSD